MPQAPGLAERDPRAAAAEVADWYTGRLRPKLLRAAQERTISPEAASELERQMTSMLRTRGARTGQRRLRRSTATPRSASRRRRGQNAALAGEVRGSTSAM